MPESKSRRSRWLASCLTLGVALASPSTGASAPARPAPSPARKPAAAAAPISAPSSSGLAAVPAAEAPTVGAVSGLVILGTGRPPKQKEMTNSVDVETCGTSLNWRPLVIGKEGEVEAAFVEVRTLDDAALPPISPPTAPPELVVDLRACGHWPPVIVVPVGSSILLRNLDGLAHELVSSAIVNAPFEGRMPRYRRRLVVSGDHLARPEHVTVTCLRHTSMVGRWIVTDNTRVAVTSASGRFTLPALPPGRHLVRAWHGELGQAEQEVDITAGVTTHVTLVFR